MHILHFVTYVLHFTSQVQSKIDHFFPSVWNEPRPIKSERLQKVLTKFRNSVEESSSKKRKMDIWEDIWDSASDDDYVPTSYIRREEEPDVRRSRRVSRKVIPSLGKKKKKKKKKRKKEEKEESQVQVSVESQTMSDKNGAEIVDNSKNAGSNGVIEIKEEVISSNIGVRRSERRGKGRLGVKGKGKLLAKKTTGQVKKSRSGPQLSASDSD